MLISILENILKLRAVVLHCVFVFLIHDLFFLHLTLETPPSKEKKKEQKNNHKNSSYYPNPSLPDPTPLKKQKKCKKKNRLLYSDFHGTKSSV